MKTELAARMKSELDSGAAQRPRYSAADIAAAVGLPHAPTPEQAAVIEAPLRPLLVVAGAGSGKTETMAARVVWLVANRFVEPDEVLGLTFTRKAAGELADRISTRLEALRRAGLWAPAAAADDSALAGTPTISTYHSYAGRLLQEHGLLIGVEPEARLLTEAATWQLAHEAVLAWDGAMDGVEASVSTVTAAVLDLAGELAEHLGTPTDVERFLRTTIDELEHHQPGETRRRVHPLHKVIQSLRSRLAIAPIVQRFNALKAERELLDFADQMALAARLARGHRQIGALERQRFAAVLLDEFQDTSHAQLALLTSLFVAAGEPVPVTAVGDPHQSIYGWRGASATTLEAFVEGFADHEPARQLSLSTSWRNDSGILTAANLTAASLRAGSRGILAPELRARSAAGPGKVLLARFETPESEATAIADWLRAQRSEDPTASAAVLCRKRSQFQAVVHALEEAGIPHEIVGMGGLLTTPEVGDVLALLHVVADPSRGDHLMRLLTGPRVRLGAADLDALAVWARCRTGPERSSTGDDLSIGRDLSADAVLRPSIVEAIEDLPGEDWLGPRGEHLGATARERLGGLARVVVQLRDIAGAPLPELIVEAERSLGIDIELLARREHDPQASRQHLDAFAEFAGQFAAGSDRPSLGGFLAWTQAALELERGLDSGVVQSDPRAVQVMTIHAAKGLEWDLVAVPGLVEGTFPSRTAKVSAQDGCWVVSQPRNPAWLGGLTGRGLPYPLRGDGDGLPVFEYTAASGWDELASAWERFREQTGRHELLEERRLAYVAFTRARRELLATASVWGSGSGHTPKVTSDFLVELHDAAGAHGLLTDATIMQWHPMPPTDPTPRRPEGSDQDAVHWPLEPDPGRGRVIAAAASSVRSAMAGAPSRAPSGSTGVVDLLLAEHRERRRSVDPGVELPGHLSTSQLVALTQEPSRFALDLRRPVPARPNPAARRGTAFHAWAEQHFGQAAMVGPEEIPGSADEDASPDEDLPRLQAHFLATEWAGRTPVEVETAVETVIDGVAVRGRIDAVFREGDGWVIVDWKTGRSPVGELQEERVLQLAVYRLAWSRLRSVPLEQVTIAFCFVADGRTIRPQPLDEARIIELLRGAATPA